jgi:hypothetical protein
VRLPPGRYQVRVVKSGRLCHEQSIDLERHERLVLTCKIPTPPRHDWVGKKPFVLLARGQRPEVGFDTLREAALEADPGDSIEVRGDGPFVGQPISLDRPLAIRAGAGYRPVLRKDPAAAGHYLHSTAALVLEGLDLDGWTSPAQEKTHFGLVYCAGPLALANCRVRMRGPGLGVSNQSALCDIRNCEFFCTAWAGLSWNVPATGSVVFDNCLFVRTFVSLEMDPAGPRDVSVRLSRNTWTAREEALEIRLSTTRPAGARRPVRWEVSGNVFRYARALAYINQWPDTPLGPPEVEVLSKRLLAWKEKGNLYPPLLPLLKFTHRFADLPDSEPVKDLAGWRKFWALKDEAGSSQAELRFAAADLDERLNTAPEKVVPEDFRLHPDSPGKGKGADVSLVGPGPAYERWQKTPAYREWRKQTKQVK